MKRLLLLPILAIVCALQPAGAQQADRIQWQQRPETITLTVDRETALHFPAPVEFKYPRTIAAHIEVVGLGNRVFIRPKNELSPTRVHAQSIDGGTYFIFDLSATTSDAGVAPAEILIVDDTSTRSAGTSDAPAPASGSDWSSSLVPLVRFMAAQFYGPQRLARPLAGARRISVDTTPIDLLPLQHQVAAIPQAGWSYRGMYGYAVKLVNHGSHDYMLDPRDFRGAWISATPQHTLLTAARTPAADARSTNETIVYLTASSPMRRAVRVASEATRQDAP